MERDEQPGDLKAEGIKGRLKKTLIILMLGLTGIGLAVYRFLCLRTGRKQQ
jgi:hypothetical protein